MRGSVGTDIGIKLSLHSKTHPLFIKYSNGTSTQCHAYQLVSCAFSTIPIYPFLIHLFVCTCIHVCVFSLLLRIVCMYMYIYDVLVQLLGSVPMLAQLVCTLSTV